MRVKKIFTTPFSLSWRTLSLKLGTYGLFFVAEMGFAFSQFAANSCKSGKEMMFTYVLSVFTLQLIKRFQI